MRFVRKSSLDEKFIVKANQRTHFRSFHQDLLLKAYIFNYILFIEQSQALSQTKIILSHSIQLGSGNCKW